VKLRGPALGIVVTLTLAALGTMAVTELLVTPWVVAGDSMLPVLHPGDRILVDRWTYRHRRARIGEVVLLDGPWAAALVKRVARSPARTSRDQLWVLGDNPDDSVDSRSLGLLPAGALAGRVVFRYWPPSRFGSLRRAGESVERSAGSAGTPPVR
jgi:signal peptidase I